MYDIIDSAIFTHLWVWTVVLITLVMCGFCVDWLLSVLWHCQLAPVCQSTAPLITKRFLETLAGHLADPRKWETGDKTVMCVCVCACCRCYESSMAYGACWDWRRRRQWRQLSAWHVILALLTPQLQYVGRRSRQIWSWAFPVMATVSRFDFMWWSELYVFSHFTSQFKISYCSFYTYKYFLKHLLFALNRDTAVPAEGNGDLQTLNHWSVSLWRDPDDVSCCRILSPDKTEWQLISATLCRWRRCFVADQLWLMKRICEEEDWTEPFLYIYYTRYPHNASHCVQVASFPFQASFQLAGRLQHASVTPTASFSFPGTFNAALQYLARIQCRSIIQSVFMGSSSFSICSILSFRLMTDHSPTFSLYTMHDW